MYQSRKGRKRKPEESKKRKPRLTDRVEVPVVPRIRANSSSVLPVPPVRARIVVDQLLFKDLGSSSPIDEKILRQVTSDVLTSSVALEAGETKLVHVGVDESRGQGCR